MNLLLFDSEGVPERKSSMVDNLRDRIGDDRSICAEKGQALARLQVEETANETEVRPSEFLSLSDTKRSGFGGIA